jgi:hypothetical protein
MCAMPQNKVVSIESLRPAKPARRVASDRSEAARVSQSRFIVQIGSQRLAFDLTTQISELDPGVGDGPAPVVIHGPQVEQSPCKGHTQAAEPEALIGLSATARGSTLVAWVEGE